MKFTLAWLKDHLETTADAAAVAATLNAIGLEVESVDNPAEALSAFRIARVLSASPHPQADKLQVLSVDAGDGPQQVVCGAPNARAGLVGVFGAPGAVVPANGMILKVAAIRGVDSHGMMCSARELELGDDQDGIIELPADAPVGTPYADWAALDDAVFDVAVTPNRQDCMAVRGIARDLAAAGLGTLKPLDVPVIEGTGTCAVHIQIDDFDGCPAFFGRSIAGVRNGPSPDWLQRRLKAIGQRPISALVDITNYVMFDLGRPSHAYDVARLSGAVVARRATDGEEATALNGKSYTLTPAMTVIADDTQVHDIAGIMGGEHSGVGEDTTDVLLEVAYFTPDHIARTGQALALTSDARTRFERGVDPAFLDDALAILTARIVTLCGGTPSIATRAGLPPATTHSLAYDPAECARLGGIDIPAEEQRAILAALGFGVTDDWAVTAPSWRRDIDGTADLVEEVVRITGLDRIVSTPLPRAPGVAVPTATPEQRIERKVRRAAAARGLHEAVTWSFIGEAEAAAFGGGQAVVANPISEEMKVMRPTLLAGLLSATARNVARDADSIRLFEVGRRYLDTERPTVGLVLAGQRRARDWTAGKGETFDAFDAKAEALALLEAAGAPIDNLLVMGDAGAHYHPGRSGTLRLGPKTVLATFGAVHPAIAGKFDLTLPVVMAEVYLDAVPVPRHATVRRPTYAPPRLQVVRRDFAFLVPDDVPADALVRALKGADKAAIVGVRVFDRFVGTGVPAGQCSLGIEVTLQPGERSFDEAALTVVSERIVAAAGKLGGVLRV